MNVCALANLSILTNSVKLRRKCFEYLLECNRKKIFVADLDSMDKDFAFELMKSSFSQSPNLNKFEMIPQIVEQVQNQPPQIRRSFVVEVIEITAFMLIASFLIGKFLTNDDDSFFQSINQLWRKHIFCGIQLLWFGIYFAIDHFQVLRQQKYLKWISLMVFVALSGFLVASCINYYGQHVAVFAAHKVAVHKIAVFVVLESIFPISFAGGFMKYALIKSGVAIDIFIIWRYCLIPNVFILLIKDFLPFPWLFSVISCSMCAIPTTLSFIVHFLQVLGNKSVVIPENEFCRASLTLFTIISQLLIFLLGLLSGIIETNIEYDLHSLVSYFSS
uniref:Uncharacterized protein n=1 Tax=Panagrolaimus davidi TaxID=227884 RepID=A0A914P7A0_9BILA